MTSSDRAPLEPRANDPFLAEATGGDPYREWDASYVLGALSPAERREFEEHLATCAGCRSAIAELAGMPGLLGQISPDDAAVMAAAPSEASGLVAGGFTTGPRRSAQSYPAGAPGPDGELDTTMPNTLVPRVGSLRDRQRRLVVAVVALAAAFVLLAGVVGVAAVRGSFPVSRTSANAPFTVAFVQVVPSGVTANVTVVPVPSGTELHLACQYSNEYSSEIGVRYNIFVRDRAGHETQVKTWIAKKDKVNTPSATSELPVSKIASVEIRPDGSDQAWLRADLR